MIDGTVVVNKLLAPQISQKYIFWLSVLMILIASSFSYLMGYYGGDLYGVGYQVKLSELIFFTVIYLIGLPVSWFFAQKFSCFKVSDYCFSYRNKQIFSLALFLFFFLVVLLALWGGVGTIQRDVNTNRYAELFFALFDPYIFMALSIYFVYLNFGKSFFDRFVLITLSSVYVFLILRSGFTGFFILMLPIFVLALLKIMSRFKVFLVLAGSILLFPFVRIFKWIVGSGLNVSDIDLPMIFIAAQGVIERFSAVPNMVYIENELINKTVLLETNYLPFFQGYIGSFVHKLFFSSPVYLNTLYLHKTMQGVNTDSNSTFPLLSYFSLDVYVGCLTLIYGLLLIFILSCLLSLIFGKSLLGRKLVSFFLFFVIFFYMFNGWFWAVWGVIQASVLFIFFLLLVGKLSTQCQVIK
ncbi:oligosaccharide repeat unit polymerase [Vibrio metschnikovii]|uniref:oligosaccharide repeat unit polymerase n=1 Tax=Vibrio metschnikovii TaxID=28172 RepID=UPI0013025ACE|nr:oligosaccharide repeat unit polymerase [Vibrio metschnikovii]